MSLMDLANHAYNARNNSLILLCIIVISLFLIAAFRAHRAFKECLEEIPEDDNDIPSPR